MSTTDFPKQNSGDNFFVFIIQFLFLTNNKRLYLKLNFFLYFLFFIFALAVIVLNFINLSKLLVARLTKPLLLAGYCRLSSAIDFCCCCCCCCRCCFCCCRCFVPSKRIIRALGLSFKLKGYQYSYLKPSVRGRFT